MQQGDYTTNTPYYPPNPNPNPTTFNHASAPPDYYPPYNPPTAPSYTPPLPNPNPNPNPPFDSSHHPHYSSSPYNNNNNNINNNNTYPTQPPSQFSTQVPSQSLTQFSSQFPSQVPSQAPSQFPTTPLSQPPSQFSSQFPSQPLSQLPSQFASLSLSQDPSQPLSQLPSQFGSLSLSQDPSQFPSQVPSQFPSQYDTGYGGNYGRSGSDVGVGGGGVDYYGKRPEMGNSRFESTGGGGYGYGEGVYAYQGGKVEPYGSRGTGAKSSTWKEQVMFDDFGRPIGGPGVKGKELGYGSSAPKIVKAVPKVETSEDVKGGVQKFRVKLLAESGGQSTMDVLCQVGLDGIRMLDPSTSRTLRIYSLDTITRCEKYDSSTLAFWSKSSVDIEPRRIRLQSNSYTTNTLLDTVTAATIQAKEIGGRSRPVEAVKFTEPSTEKKKGLGDWMNMIKPASEEKDHWVPDEAVTKCTGCGSDFSAFNRKHHCRNCGDIFCDKCTQGRTALTSEENAQQVRVCDRCMAEVTHRLSSAKEAAASRSSGLQSHEDLAKKLQELERTHKSSSGSRSEGSSRRMKEVACPTCTVHLQVQVPVSGSETIECGVCQHPFLVNAR